MNTLKDKNTSIDDIGDSHVMTSIETPMRSDAFAISASEKINRIAELFYGIMHELGLDLNDDSLSGTPHRVAKLYINELFYGLNPLNKPNLSTFSNKYGYNKILIEKDIRVNSACEHHFLPIVGKAHIGYLAKEKVIDLSKLNRIVDYYAHRPQVQERLTIQIFNELKSILQTDDIIVVIEADHLCVSARGVKDITSSTLTVEHGGVFSTADKRAEFFNLIK
ncbi:GTP cyclohydrolase I FolE [Sphingobacterium sp. BIGb0165]|uniref:GTP cyclohydrolase I FolE n=1 Tax=Sphingobacterium sp. BIGb0165 TaxID=2940615 RepID=UPI002168EA51|nr:GTP cyclohydrolase I FolE [Sphingobacterium sp. BIGb0165]MCS4226999.1 GTP cyclohydrolase I [Sphingobacterium sp. BIGb0165]